MKEQNLFYFAVFRKKDGNLLGYVTIADILREVFQSAIYGYIIFNNYWGQGYGKEAAKGCMEMALKKLNFHRLEALIETDNKISINLSKKLGFRKESRSKNRIYVRDKWRDAYIYAIACEDLGIKYKFKK